MENKGKHTCQRSLGRLIKGQNGKSVNSSYKWHASVNAQFSCSSFVPVALVHAQTPKLSIGWSCNDGEKHNSNIVGIMPTRHNVHRTRHDRVSKSVSQKVWSVSNVLRSEYKWLFWLENMHTKSKIITLALLINFLTEIQLQDFVHALWLFISVALIDGCPLKSILFPPACDRKVLRRDGNWP